AALEDVAVQLDDAALDEPRHLRGPQAGLFPAFAHERLARGLAARDASADEVVETARIRRLRRRATRDPEMGGAPVCIGHVAVAMRAEGERAPEAAGRALDRRVLAARAIAQGVWLVAPRADQPALVQVSMDLGQARIAVAGRQAQREGARRRVGPP